MHIIGTDEAGYGPNLGPLVVSATVWSAPGEELSDLCATLKKHGIEIGDSKKLYHAAGSLAPLEIGVRTAIQVLGTTLEKVVAPVESPPCWETVSPLNTPPSVSKKQIDEIAETFKSTLGSFGIELLRLRSRVLSAELFNKRLDKVDSKGTLLSDTTLDLVAEMIDKLPHGKKKKEKILVLCDKHGGRNRYLDILCKHFPGEFFHVVEESRPLSVYRSKIDGFNAEFRFQSKGESQISVALASMLSKYIRELAMSAFNSFWCSEIPGLKSTAGYPEDAKRFRAETDIVRQRLGISDDVFWRRK